MSGQWWLVAFVVLVAVAGFAFWRGLGNRPDPGNYDHWPPGSGN